MRVIEFPKDKTEHQSAREFLTQLTELVDNGDYRPCAFVVVMVEEEAMIPLAVNLTKHEIISYLEVAKGCIVDSLRDAS